MMCRYGRWMNRAGQQGTIRIALTAAMFLAPTGVSFAQQATTPPPAKTPVYLPIPAFDSSSLDIAADPCNDFYQYACGKFAANHPIPADQTEVDQFYALFNVNSQKLNGILAKVAVGGTSRTPEQQKIGDFYKACVDTDAIEQKGLAPIQKMLYEIDSLSDGMRGKLALPKLIGKLQRMNVDVFFGYGEQLDFKDAS